MRTRLVALTSVLALGAALAASAQARDAAATKPCSGDTATAGTYKVALVLGPRQEMYMPSEVRARKIKKGQVMLGGAMAMIDRVPAGMRVYDLAVYVCTKSGAVVSQLKPAITVQPAGQKARPLAVAMMAAVGKGLGDYHYGNDVALKPGSDVTVTVTVKGKRGVLHASVPRTGSATGSGMDHAMDMDGMGMG